MNKAAITNSRFRRFSPDKDAAPEGTAVKIISISPNPVIAPKAGDDVQLRVLVD
jgi:hypothetical protein